MSKRNTRVRVTRIAAAAVIAAGASMTAVGAAQAVTSDGGVAVHAQLGPQDEDGGSESGGTLPTDEPTTPTDEPTTPTDEPTTPTDEPTTPTDEPTTPTTEPTTPTTEPTTPTTEPTTPGGGHTTPPGTGHTTPPATGATGGASSTGGNDNTCTLTGDSVDCGNNNPGTDNTQQVAQGQTTTQLAETGSSGTTFMIIGAATLIAGGIGFRVTPRLARRGGAA